MVIFCAVCLALCLPNIGWGSSKKQIRSETNLLVNDNAQVNNNEAQNYEVQATGDMAGWLVVILAIALTVSCAVATSLQRKNKN